MATRLAGSLGRKQLHNRDLSSIFLGSFSGSNDFLITSSFWSIRCLMPSSLVRCATSKNLSSTPSKKRLRLRNRFAANSSATLASRSAASVTYFVSAVASSWLLSQVQYSGSIAVSNLLSKSSLRNFQGRVLEPEYEFQGRRLRLEYKFQAETQNSNTPDCRLVLNQIDPFDRFPEQLHRQRCPMRLLETSNLRCKFPVETISRTRLPAGEFRSFVTYAFASGPSIDRMDSKI